jgi:hypothetical protein
MEELEATLNRILRKAEIMRLDAKTPTASADAEEVRLLTQMALRKLENLNHATCTTTGGSRPED